MSVPAGCDPLALQLHRPSATHPLLALFPALKLHRCPCPHTLSATIMSLAAIMVLRQGSCMTSVWRRWWTACFVGTMQQCLHTARQEVARLTQVSASQ